MTLLGITLGVFIGLALGALGGGGSILTVPVLVYVLGQNARSATGASLVIVGVTALCGTISHARAGHVRLRAGAAFGAAGILASYAGTALNRLVAPNVLLLCFAALMAVSAAGMLRRPGPPRPVGDRRALRVVLAGLAVGFLTGFLGVGGGFVIVPALVGALGYDMPVAVGTSLLVIAVNSAAALAARAGQETLHWAVILPLTAAAVAGSLAGRRLAANVPPSTLRRAFAILVLGVASYLVIGCAVGAA